MGMERIPIYLRLSEQVAGWTRGPEAEALIRVAYELPDHAIIVEIGSFLGSGSILLGGARKLRRTGKVHCIDPFDASGDLVSVSEYERILADHTNGPQIQTFHENIRHAGLTNWIRVHQGRAEQIGTGWSVPIDMIFMDGDQSPEGVIAAYDIWGAWLKTNGVLALHNSNPREYARGHDGHFRLRERLLTASDYLLAEEVGSISFFRKKAGNRTGSSDRNLETCPTTR
jgi:predicted O-methyltransferase YrrM